MAAELHRLPVTKQSEDQERERFLWRQAVALFGQLPESDEDMRRVIHHMLALCEQAPPEPKKRA